MMDEVGAEIRGAISSRLAWLGLLSRWMLCILGTFFLVFAMVLTGNTLLFLHISIAETGMVVSNVRVEQRDSDGQASVQFAPEFSFSDADGRTHTVTSTTSSNPPEFAEGQAVRVLYNPRNPRIARIDSFRQLWFLSVVFGAVGAVFGAVGYAWMYFVVKRHREVLSIR